MNGRKWATAAFLAGVNAAALEAYSDPDRTLWRAYRLRGLPTTALIGADGVEIARKEGEAEWDSAEAQGEIDKAPRPIRRIRLEKIAKTDGIKKQT